MARGWGRQARSVNAQILCKREQDKRQMRREESGVSWREGEDGKRNGETSGGVTVANHLQ